MNKPIKKILKISGALGLACVVIISLLILLDARIRSQPGHFRKIHGKVTAITTDATSNRSRLIYDSGCTFIEIDNNTAVAVNCSNNDPGFTDDYDKDLKIGDTVEGRGIYRSYDKSTKQRLFVIADNDLANGYSHAYNHLYRTNAHSND